MPKIPVIQPQGPGRVGARIDAAAPIREANINAQTAAIAARAIGRTAQNVSNAFAIKRGRQELMERDTADNALHTDMQEFDRHWGSSDRFPSQDLEAAGVKDVQLTKTVGGQQVPRGDVPTSEFLPELRFDAGNKRIDELAQDIKNPRLRDEWVAKMKGRNESEFTQNTIRAVKVQKEQRQQMLDDNYAVAEQSGDFEYMRDLVDTMELTDEERTRRQTVVDVVEEVEGIDSVMLSGTQGEMSALEKQLRDPKVDSTLTTKTRLQKADQLKSRIKDNSAKNDNQLIKSLQGVIKERGFGTDNGLAESAADGIQDEFKRDAVKEQIRVAIKSGDFVHEMVTNTPGQNAQEFMRLTKAMQEPGDFTEESAELAAKHDAFTRFARQYQDDPVQTMQQVNPALKVQQEQLIQMEQEGADPELLRLAEQEYQETLIATQERMGTPRTDTVLLSNNQVAAFNQLYTETNEEQKHLLLVQTQQQYGDQWPRVLKQLQKEQIIVGVDRIAAAQSPFTDGPVARQLFRGKANGGAKEILKRLGVTGTDKTDFETAVRDKLAPWFTTLNNSQDRSGLYDDMFDAAETTAAEMMQEGTANLQSAPEKAVQQLLLNKYYEIETDDTYRMMKPGAFGGGVTNPDKVRRVLKHIRRNPQDFNYDQPLTRFGLDEGLTREMSEEDLRSRSYWVTDGNELGVMLVDGEKNPVTKNGEAVRLSWEEIEAHKDITVFETRRGAKARQQQQTEIEKAVKRFGGGR
jgi:hypothetical protein